MKTTTKAKATPKKAGTFTAAINAIKALSYEDRKRLIEEVNKAHGADNEQFSLGQSPDGAGYMTMEDSLSSTEE